MARKDPRRVSREDHLKIQQMANLGPTEDYAVTVQKGKPDWVKTTHVFARRPTLQEINTYEKTASRVKFRGANAEMEGSQITAAVNLYNLIIARAYDVLVGPIKVEPELNAQQAREKVDPLIKREAIRELVGEVYSASRMEEALGGGEQEEEAANSEDDPEGHTSGALAGSEQ